MNSYQHILVGLDLSPTDSQAVINRAVALASMLGADLSLIHVIEPLAFAYAGDIPIDLTDTQMVMEKHADESLKNLAQTLSITPRHMQVTVGNTAEELRSTAADINADLIVVGSHARHGLALLLGSTASSVLKNAGCDVLAVKV